MSDATLTAFLKDLEATKRYLDGFAKFFGDARYRYYHSEPPVPVPDEVWHYIADDHECIAYENLDSSPDGTACLRWEEQDPFDVKKFKLLCRKCCRALWEHAETLATVDEIRNVVEMPSGYYQWVRLIHRIAETDPVLSGLVNKCLVVSQRPLDATQNERVPEWAQGHGHGELDELEEQLVHALQERGESPPDVWFEYIPPPCSIVEFHSQMLDVLGNLVQDSYPDQEGRQASLAMQQPDQSGTAKTAKDEKPQWDKQTRKLKYKKYLIKEFKQPAANQSLVFAAFEEFGWPDWIDDPLPQKPGIDPKRRLNRTVADLNENHKTRHKMYFSADNNGQRIRWHEGRKPHTRRTKKPKA